MPHTTTHGDPYLIHRVALAPLLPGADGADLERACHKASALGEAEFAQFLSDQGLAPLWHHRIEQYPRRLPVSDEFLGLIHHRRLHATASYLSQRNSLTRVREILEGVGVDHVVTKGAHTRELYYDTPALRPAADIDVLVRLQDKLGAIRAFKSQGFEFHGLPENISHECSLIKGNTCIDLHWDILRPGRTRQPMTEELLEERIDYGSHWGLDTRGTLFMMLVHPVFTKYTTTPHATLVRIVDLALLLSMQSGPGAETRRLLGAAGVKTAAWITLHWLQMLTDGDSGAALESVLRPGRLRALWLRRWLSGDWSSTLQNYPEAIQFGFTLPAHDRWTDAVRALSMARQCRKNGAQALGFLQERLG